MKAIPVVQCMNEEIWIERVLRPLWRVFGTVLVGDTGSTDETPAILRRLQAEGHIRLFEFGNLNLRDVGQVRPRLAQVAREEHGAEYIFLCDGDEVHHEGALRRIAEAEMPEGKRLGFTAGCNVGWWNDELYELAPPFDLTGRTAVIPVTDSWHGAYPFECPESFDRPEGFYYFPLPEGMRYVHLHVHRCPRSSKDADVPYRLQKQYQFSMQERGKVGYGPKIDLAAWLADEKANQGEKLP